VEAAFDEDNIKADAVSEALSELKLELKVGCLRPMYQLAVALQRLAPMWVLPESKSAQGWHLRTGTEVAQRLVRTLVTERRPDLAAPADVLTRWSLRRGRKALRRLKPALDNFRAVPVFWR
jgi:inorganic triphosphatase YgiF